MIDLLNWNYWNGGKCVETASYRSLLAYPDSADAHCNLADAYLKNGQKDLARQYAEKVLDMIDSHKAPLSSWSDTEQRRAEIRSGVQDTLKELNAAH